MKNGFYLSPDGKNIVELNRHIDIDLTFDSILDGTNSYNKPYFIYHLYLGDFFRIELTKTDIRTLLSSWEILN